MKAPARRPLRKTPNLESRAIGCLVGGAVGDALGAPVEFESREAILKRFGPEGIRDYAPAYGRLGAITDDTQMTLFTADGILRGEVRSLARGLCNRTAMVQKAYVRWRRTQADLPHQSPQPNPKDRGWLWALPELHQRRAPGRTCMSALEGTQAWDGQPAKNDRKGSGGIMRVAPWAIAFAANQPGNLADAYKLAKESAWITHGHPTGYIAAGAFVALLLGLLNGKSARAALLPVLALLRKEAEGAEVLESIEAALQRAESRALPHVAIAQLGQGWVAEEALAIALYCALKFRSFESGVISAVNITGDSDTTGSLTGQLLGAIHGFKAIPARWLRPLELRQQIETVARDLLAMGTWADEGKEFEKIWARYPGTAN